MASGMPGQGTGLHLHWTMPPKQQSINPSIQASQPASRPASQSVSQPASQAVSQFKWPGHHHAHLCTCCGGGCRHFQKAAAFLCALAKFMALGECSYGMLQQNACVSSLSVLCIVCAVHKTRQICVFHMSRFARRCPKDQEPGQPNKCRRCFA